VRGVPGDISDVPLGGTGVTGVMGVGGGGMAGVFGYRGGGGRRKAIARFGGSRATESSVEAALAWLARHQEAGGGWNKGKREGEATGLATLAFLGAGYTPKTGKHRDDVKRAVAWITSRQQADGSFRVSDTDAYRAHAILTLALSEAYGMTKAPELRKAAQAAVDHALKIQKESSGWGCRKGLAPDTLTTAWSVVALKSARIAGLKVDGAGFRGAASFLDKVTKSDRTALTAASAGIPHATSTMAGALARSFMGTRRGQVIRSVRWAAGRAPGDKPDLELLYFGTLISFQMGGEDWRSWNGPLKKSLLAGQHKGGPHDGSAKDVDGCWTPAGGAGTRGRVCATALNALSLEVYYRYLRLYHK